MTTQLLGKAVLDAVLLWAHVTAAILWMGHNYVNVVLTPYYVPPATPDAREEDSWFMRSRYREHAAFRAASLVVCATGLLMLWTKGVLADALLLRGWSAVVGMGAWLAIVMTLNVWLVMWPHQKKVLGFRPASFSERVRCSRITFLCARTNTMLSIPVVFLMLSARSGFQLFR